MAKSPGVWKALRSDLPPAPHSEWIKFTTDCDEEKFWIEVKCGIRVQMRSLLNRAHMLFRDRGILTYLDKEPWSTRTLLITLTLQTLFNLNSVPLEFQRSTLPLPLCYLIRALLSVTWFQKPGCDWEATPRGWQVQAGGVRGAAVSETPNSPNPTTQCEAARPSSRPAPGWRLSPNTGSRPSLTPSSSFLPLLSPQASITSQSFLTEFKWLTVIWKTHHQPQLAQEGSVQAEICLDFLTPMGLYRDINS